MSEFNFEKYKGKYVMHCKTEQEAIDFCRVMHEYGLKWITGETYVDVNNWGILKQNTCYALNKGIAIYKLNYLEEFGDFTILEWSDFMQKKTFTKSDLKNGDVVLRYDRSVEIVCVDTGTLICKGGYNSLDYIKEDLTDKYIQHDIIAVRRPLKSSDCQFDAFKKEYGELVYEKERDKPIVEEMTLEQVCKVLGKNIKIVKG